MAMNLALVAVAFALAYALGEAAIRLLQPQQLIVVRPDIWQPADTVGWRARPSLRTSINTGEGTVSLLTDAHGFRVGRSGAAADAKRRVLLLGDSYMIALQVEYEETLASKLEGLLTDQLGEPVAVRNTGVAGWGPSQYYSQAAAELRDTTFDLVLVGLYVGNDAVPVFEPNIPARQAVPRRDLRMPRRLSWGEFVDALFYPVNDFLERRSHLFVFLKSRLQTTLMRVGLTATYFPDEFRRTEATSPRWDVTAEICERIATAAREQGIPTVFFLIPTTFQVDSAVFAHYVRGFGLDPAAVDLEQPTRLLHEGLQRRGLRVIDLLPAMRRAHETGGALFGQIDEHWTARGHDLAARVLAPELATVLGRGPLAASPPRAERPRGAPSLH